MGSFQREQDVFEVTFLSILLGPSMRIL